MEPKDLGLKLIDQVDATMSNLKTTVEAYEELGYLVGIITEFSMDIDDNQLHTYYTLQVWKFADD